MEMKLCDSLLTNGIIVECDEIVTPGFERDGVIINRRHIDFSATKFDESSKNVITELVLKTGYYGSAVHQLGNTPYNGTNTSFVKGTYVNKFNNTVSLVVLDNGPRVCQNVIDGLANGEFVVILRNKHKGLDGRSEFQIYGYYQGLHAETMDNGKYDEEVEGGWKVTLMETNAPKSGLFLWDTDLETTEAKFNALKEEL